MENSFLKIFFVIVPFFMFSQYETQEYKLISDYDGIEIRYYSPSMMIKYSGDNNSRGGFGYLFNYISGKNELEQKISMTTPVHMTQNKNGSSMEFVLPKKFTSETAPKPNNTKLELYQSKAEYFASIKYGGYTNSDKENKFTNQLIHKLKNNDISISGEPKVLVYDSPYKFINRTNEILIPIIYKK